MRLSYILCVVAFVFVLMSCSGPHAKIIYPQTNEIIENPYIQFNPPSDRKWYYFDSIRWMKSKKTSKAQWFILSSNIKSSFDEIELSTYPYKWMPIEVLFDKEGDYEARNQYLSNTPETKARNMEQGIYYDKDWVTYIQGLKCDASVFSRDGTNKQEQIRSKNYSIACGYYHKTDGKRILLISYRYRYGGRLLAQQKGRKPSKNEVTKEQAENYLKRSVAQLISTINIKDVDWKRMKQEGLIHPNTKLDMSTL